MPSHIRNKCGNAILAMICLAWAPSAVAQGVFVPKSAGLFKIDFRITDAIIDKDLAVTVNYHNDGRFTGGVPFDLPIAGVHAKAADTIVPALGIEYFITDHISIEPIFGGTKQKTRTFVDSLIFVSPSPAINASNFNVVNSVFAYSAIVPIKYHFRPDARFSPYIGAGMAYYWFANEASSTGQPLSVLDTRGYVVQVGFDYALHGNWSINLDAKQMFVENEAVVTDPFGGATTSTTKPDPLIISAGFGYRF
ncbi:MAG: outer membrane protein [Hyphomonadaceae bacterium]|nr:MAG: outer membrane protein [Hyphomonadaceae bacterium]KAF0185394.1 MAG: outer membrane protein [Hyphomonadaceae bacterium]